MKECELCKLPANIHCESDQAILCWECDAKVHEANFLVARHSRILLCRSCQAPTPWRSSGARLSYSVSVCERCESFQEDAVVTDEEEEGDNQLVPSGVSPPPDFGSSNGIEEKEIGDTAYIGFKLVFAGGAVMKLPSRNVMVDVKKGRTCLAFAAAGGVAIIGNRQQEGFKVVYDVGKGRIGFSGGECG